MIEVQLITVEKILQDLKNPLGDNLSPKRISQITEEATEWGKKAYEENDVETNAYVERLLYTIHSESHFAPPLQTMSSTVWMVLMKAKLNNNLKDFVGKPTLEAKEMASFLENTIKETEERDHDLMDRITGDEVIRTGGLKGLIVYTKNWYGSTHGFTHQMISLAQRCNTDLKKTIFENLSDELNTPIPHREMRARWPRRIGLDYDPVRSLEDEDQLTESFSLSNFRTGLTMLNTPTYALGSFYTVEANFPGVCRRMASLKHHGFSEEDLGIFISHLQGDEDHAAEWIEALETADLTPAERVQVVNGGLSQLAVRQRMFDAMKVYLYG